MSKKALTLSRFKTADWILWAASIPALVTLALFLAWISNGKFTELGAGPARFTGTIPFLVALILAGGFLLAGRRLLQACEPVRLPKWLAAALVAAFLFRLGLGVLWSVALPKYGHEGEGENAGYVMADAFERDRAAWELGQSDKPLIRAFLGSYRRADQYGGLLYASAAVYRYLGAEDHYPLLVVVFTSALSALSVLMVWGFARRAWNGQAATVASLGLVFYPEAALLGSSQMREAFTLTLTIAAFYGLVRFSHSRSWVSLAWVIFPILLYLPFSPPFAAWLLAMLFLAGLGLGPGRLPRSRHSWRFWLAILGVAVLVLAGAWLALRQFSPEGMNNPLSVARWWLIKSADFQAHLTRSASGWMQKIFANSPDWLHSPILIGYGIMQPFLPAAILHRSDALAWWLIGIWRALGWNLMLPVLAYASLRALFFNGKNGFTRMLVVILWLGILVAAFRGGGDQWDNSRYRATFAGLQIALIAWALVEQRRKADPWLRRALISTGLVLAWFVPWYLRRYAPFTWYISDVFRTLGLGLVSSALFILWDWARSQPQPVSEAESPEAEPPPDAVRPPSEDRL
jgi:hypothetical protein